MHRSVVSQGFEQKVDTDSECHPFCGSLTSRGLPGFFFFLIYLFLAALGLQCCTRAFSSFREWGLPFAAVCGLLIVEHGL